MAVLTPSSILSTVAVILLAAIYRSRTRRISNDIPSGPQEPLRYRFFSEPTHAQLSHWALTIPNEGLIQYRGSFNQPRVLVTSLAGIEEVHQRNAYVFEKDPVNRTFLTSILGDGLVTAVGESHKLQRKLLQPVFKLASVRALHPLFWTKTAELVATVERNCRESSAGADAGSGPHADPQTVELIDFVNRATLDLIGSAGFGLDFKCLAEPGNELWKEYAAVFHSFQGIKLYKTLAYILPEPILHALPIRRNRDLAKATAVVRSRIAAAIEPARANNSTASTNIITALTRSGVTDLPMLINQSLAILGAGHDTVAQTICLAIYHLSKDIPLQQRVRDEILQAELPDLGPVTSDAAGLEKIESLPLLTALMNETLRLYPTISILTRQATQDVELCGKVVPRGTNVVTVAGAVQRDPRVWGCAAGAEDEDVEKRKPRDLETFDADRWLPPSPSPATGGAPSHAAFLTFGHGPRQCIGERFARAEMGFMISGLVRAFDIEFVGTGVRGEQREVEMVVAVVRRIKGGLWVRMRPRVS